MSRYEERLAALRAELKQRTLHGFVVPLTDEHMSEYVGDYAKRLKWLTGFRGSAGTAVVLAEEATIFVDGRYTLQVRQQVSARQWSYQSVREVTPAAWLRDHAAAGSRIGYDPWLHTASWVQATAAELATRGAQLVAVDTNPIDAVWADRPTPVDAKLTVYPEQFAGKTSARKREEIAAAIAASGADAVLLCALDCVAWTFNLRGRDIEHTPVALAYALVGADAAADLFVAPEKLSDEVMRHLGDSVQIQSRATFLDYLATLNGRRIMINPERTVAAITTALEAAGAQVIKSRDPVVLLKAIKNSAEIAAHRSAQLNDGVALCRFLQWLAVEAPKSKLTELSAASKLLELRAESGELLDISFDTISAFGANGAIVHYYPSEDTNRPIEPGSLYLVDSGGQYLQGTTDVTRTVAIGKPNAEMRDRFTRVLKGHIALARAVFPVGTRGFQLDMLARQFLWEAGLDYAHATGHGIGAYLDVHEGPQLIHNTVRGDEPLLPGMILSNEPGYYKSGDYGIRFENLMLVVKCAISGAEREMLAFETLTLAPIDVALIDLAMLTAQERIWIDAYHARVREVIGPRLQSEQKAWLMDATQPLE